MGKPAGAFHTREGAPDLLEKSKKAQCKKGRTDPPRRLQHCEIAASTFAGLLAPSYVSKTLVGAVVGGAKSQPQPGMLTKGGQTSLPGFLARCHEFSALTLLVQESVGGTLKTLWRYQKRVE